MRRYFCAICFVLLTAGCSTIPFEKTMLVPLDSDPRGMVERFEATMATRFQLLTTVVFEYNWRTFSGLGSLSIDRADGLFKAAGVNAMGVKLFEISGDRNVVTSHYAIDALSERGDMAVAVGDDIRRIYFDLIPAADARSTKRKYKISFRQLSGPGFLEYVFGGGNGDLIEKSYSENNQVVWRASYYEYRNDENGKRWPYGIVFVHYDYGYRLTIRQKESHA